ncbi:hypothetical protein ACHWQZ_G009679 [Mnemiopsis leidyi]
MADRDEGFEEYEPLPYNAKKWILPGTILFFLVNLIIAMVVMNIRERSVRYRLLQSQRSGAADGKTNGKVTQHATIPPGIDISTSVYPPALEA